MISPRRPFSPSGLGRGRSTGTVTSDPGCSQSPGERRRVASANGFGPRSATRPITVLFHEVKLKNLRPKIGSHCARRSYHCRLVSGQRWCCAWGVTIRMLRSPKCSVFLWGQSNRTCCVAGRSCGASWETSHESKSGRSDRRTSSSGRSIGARSHISHAGLRTARASAVSAAGIYVTRGPTRACPCVDIHHDNRRGNELGCGGRACLRHCSCRRLLRLSRPTAANS